jgi:hypothetical protein
MKAHTQGPWFISLEGRFVRYRIGGTGFAYNVCAMEAFGGPEDEKWANAHLIAAAPELLEALEHMVAVSNWATTIQSEEQYDAMIANAEAAIRKAKGE